MTLIETGQTVQWRGSRWRVLGEDEGGFLRLVGLDPAVKDLQVTPLLALEQGEMSPDERPLPPLDVEASDRSRWRALHRAYATSLAGGREQLVGLDWGAVAVEPYQLVPLLRVAKTLRPRLLIADDTGLGKTAEAGIVLRWLAQRHQANRVLVVTRAAPEPERWQRELWTKFGFRFNILTSGADFNLRRRRNPTVNVFAQERHLIVSMTLAARQALLDELRQCPSPFDVVIVDEAAHLAERGSRTKRLALLGRELSRKSADGALVLLTATPHDGKTESFLSLLRLLEPFIEVEPGQVPLDAASRLVVRRLKPEVTLAGGRRFREPQIHVRSTLALASKEERALDPALTAYLAWLGREEARYASEGARQKATGCQFLATLYLKRLGSSVAALRATLRRRLGLPSAPEDADDRVPYVETDASDPEDNAIDPEADAEAPPPDLTAAEAELARALLDAAQRVPPGQDSKLVALAQLVTGDLVSEKVVVFTEYRDTLRAAARRLEAEGVSFVTFHGGTPERDRRQALRDFLHEADIRLFLATDAASEGINLQSAAHHLVHLDVPWNPNRYAQRNGRIDRYGQEATPTVWALVAADERRTHQGPETRALEIVIDKLRRIAEELRSVGAVLPGYSSGSVRRLLQLAKDDTPDTARAQEDLSRLVTRNQAEIAEAERYVKRLGTVDDFEANIGELLRTAFHGWDDGGAVEAIGGGIVRARVPARLRGEIGTSVIEQATFRREVAVLATNDEGEPPEFLSPAHPLVEATLRALRDEASDPAFAHRFDVVVGDAAGLALSFVTRFVDGEGRTVEEALGAVETRLDGSVSRDPVADLARLGVDEQGGVGVPAPTQVEPWKAAFPDLAQVARAEALRRADTRRTELSSLARELVEEELVALGRWRGEEERRVETLTLGNSAQLTFEASEAYQQRLRQLEAEYDRRRATIRDRSDVRLAGLELLGGRLIVAAAP